MMGIFDLSVDVNLWLKLIDGYENLEGSEFYLWRHEYADLGGIYEESLESRFNDITPILFNEKIIMTGYLHLLEFLDYFTVLPSLYVMNQKMLDAFLSVRDFPYEKLPCRIMDVGGLKSEDGLEYRQYANDALAAKYPHNDDYFFLHLTSHTSLPQGLQTDTAGLPPILRPNPEDGIFGTYVTQQGKDALIAAQIHGVDFTVPYQYQEPLQN